MRWRLWALAGVAALALAGCGAGDSNPFNDFFGGGTVPNGSIVVQVPCTVSGYIMRDVQGHPKVSATSAVGTPIAGAVVSIPEQHLTYTTGADGFYRFTDVASGTITLRVAVPGSATANFTVKLDPGQNLIGLPAGANL